MYIDFFGICITFAPQYIILMKTMKSTRSLLRPKFGEMSLFLPPSSKGGNEMHVDFERAILGTKDQGT